MEFKPVLRFAVMNDVHFCKEHPERRTTLKKAVKEELEKARADTGNKPIFVFQHAGIPETIVGGGWEELCELCDELNSDKIGICWDFGHANTANLSQEKALGEIGNRLKITHVHDNSKNGDHHQLPLLGGDECGCINWTETMSAVKSINYKGPLTLELIYPPKQMLEGFIKCCFDSLECLKNM